MVITFAFKGGLSFNLGDVIIPDEKDTMITDAYNQVDEVTAQTITWDSLQITKDITKLLIFGRIPMLTFD